MLKDFIERRRMKRRILSLNRSLFNRDLVDEDVSILVRAAKAQEIKAKLDPLEKQFDFSETMRLEAKALRFGVEIPRDREGWWYNNDTYGFSASTLNERGQAGAKKIIRDEILSIGKTVVGMLVPVLSLVVAILALSFKSC